MLICDVCEKKDVLPTGPSATEQADIVSRLDLGLMGFLGAARSNRCGSSTEILDLSFPIDVCGACESPLKLEAKKAMDVAKETIEKWIGAQNKTC